MSLQLILALAAIARADAPPVFSQDPLCAETKAQFSDRFSRSLMAHRKHRPLRNVVEGQNLWFDDAVGEMTRHCEADAKFAAQLAGKQHPSLNGQCKPAAEAAMSDQEVLDHSEEELKDLGDKLSALTSNKAKPGRESLPALFEHDYKRVENDSFELNELPRIAGCELAWIYPRAYIKTKPPFTGCSDAAPGLKVQDEDKDDPGVFAQILTRYRLSITYNKQRRDHARATANASRARYESCVAQFPGEENVLKKAAATKGNGAGAASGGKSPKGASDITGVDEDKKKQSP